MERRPRGSAVLASLLVLLSVAACSDQPHRAPAGAAGAAAGAEPSPERSGPAAAVTSDHQDADAVDLEVVVDADHAHGPISPLIRGVSGAPSVDYMTGAGITVNSWGGNPATRYNYEIGHAWNAARDWSYRNGNYGTTGDVAASFLRETLAAGAQPRLAVPMLGWVARDDENTTCSFPQPDGSCGDANGASCSEPGTIADPATANVESTAPMVADWVEGLVQGQGFDVPYIAMDNEPELWGVTHYDVHPRCPTYEEILDRYLEYAVAVRAVAPDSQLLGPVTCCWYDFWGTAPGPAEGPHQEWLPWFLDRVRAHDEEHGVQTLDVVDVHYYPQSDVYNEDVDPDTAARRLRSTRALYDPTYVDESWIDRPIAFIPRLIATIDDHHPKTSLAITEWNYGADGTMNGALAIADVLGIYGREGVHMASYWRHPAEDSPGYRAFAMYGNYDGAGSSFQGTAVEARSPNVDAVSSFAALSADGTRLQVMLINKDAHEALRVRVALDGFEADGDLSAFRYSEEEPHQIVASDLRGGRAGTALDLPPYSITLLVVSGDRIRERS